MKTRSCPKRSACSASLAALLVLLLWTAAAARAQDRVYWSTFLGKGLSFTTLDGRFGGTFPLVGAEPSGVTGLVLDSATQRIFWGNAGPDQIAFTTLEGRAGGLFDTGGITVATPDALAIDPVERRLYWSNAGAGRGIFFADLDGSGGGPLDTTGAGDDAAAALLFDQASGRLYWTNENAFLSPPISFAALDGSGGGNLRVGLVQRPIGLAIDHAGNRIYWSTSSSIEYANLDGTGRAVLPTGPVTPTQLAIDHAAGRIYWGETSAQTVSFSRLDGSGRGVLDPVGPAAEAPQFLMISVAPRASNGPTVSGQSKRGSTLACSPATWSPDLPEASLYGAAETVATQWTLDGADIPGATSPTLTAARAGAYACRETATNRAGSTAATSPPHTILASFGPRTGVTLIPTARKAGKITIRIANANPFPIKGTLSASGARKVPFRVGPKAKTTATLRVRSTSRTLIVRAVIQDPSGHRRTVRKKIP